jgi:SlyX protein
MHDRLTELEIRCTHQERTLEELNETVCRQELLMERLEREVSLLRDQMKMLLPSLILSQEEEEPPPHY